MAGESESALVPCCPGERATWERGTGLLPDVATVPPGPIPSVLSRSGPKVLPGASRAEARADAAAMPGARGGVVFSRRLLGGAPCGPRTPALGPGRAASLGSTTYEWSRVVSLLLAS